MKLPDKKEWIKNFINSKKYNQVIQCINNIPDPDFAHVWDLSIPLRNLPLRHLFYTRKVLPLISFYYIDYISTATNGGVITNMCDSSNYFAGTFNVKNCDGSVDFTNKYPIKLEKLIVFKNGIRFDNAISICENKNCNLELLSKYINQFIDCIKYSELDGYGYIAFSSFDLKAKTPKEFLIKNDLNKFYKLNIFVDSIIESFAEKVDIIEYVNDIAENEDDSNPVDGDIRLLFRTKPLVAV